MIKIIVIILFLGISGLVLYIRYIEQSSLFIPDLLISQTPADAGMEYEDLYIPTPDRQTLNAWFIRSDDPDAATIMICHGNAGNISYRVELLQLLSRTGCSLFIFDYRGYGKSSGTPSEKGLYTDTRACYDYLTRERHLAPAKIAIYGKSLGSAPAVHLAETLDSGALIIDSAFTSAVDMGQLIFEFLPKNILKILLRTHLDSFSSIQKVRIPTLVLHSRDDRTVPYEMGRRLFEACTAEKELYTMSGTHNEAVFDNQGFVPKVKTFIKQHL